jgi:hypothetical protein
MDLPDCDALFLQYFEPWLSEQDRKRRIYTATRPDIENLDCSEELAASDVSPLTADSQTVSAQRVQEMFAAAAEDWKRLLGVGGTPSLDWLREFDRCFQRRQIEEIINGSDPRQYDNDYLVLCCELGSVLGTVLLALEPRLSWLYDWPYWESAPYDQQTRSRINVFHWAVKKMSEYGVEDGLIDKIDACRGMLRGRT